MSKLKDINIVRVLGVCLTDAPMCVIVEYMPYGDLNQFLQKHQHEGASNNPNQLYLRYVKRNISHKEWDLYSIL